MAGGGFGLDGASPSSRGRSYSESHIAPLALPLSSAVTSAVSSTAALRRGDHHHRDGSGASGAGAGASAVGSGGGSGTLMRTLLRQSLPVTKEDSSLGSSPRSEHYSNRTNPLKGHKDAIGR